MIDKKPRGRPRIHAAGTRMNFTFRVRDELRAKLRSAAEANGRSVSEEIESRLELSFHGEELIEALASRLTAQANPSVQAIDIAAIFTRDIDRNGPLRPHNLSHLFDGPA